MNKKITVSVILTLALLAAGVLGLTAYSSVSAAASTVANGDLPLAFGRGFGVGGDNTYLAEALGITTEELAAAHQSASQAAIQQALDSGLITQAQADTMAERGSAFPFGRRTGGWLVDEGIDYEALLADALGITVDELNAAQSAAQDARLEQAIADGRISEAQADLMRGRQALFGYDKFQTRMTEAYQAGVNQALEDGVITQTQADQLLEAGNGMRFGGKGFGGGFGGRHGGCE